MAEAVRLSASGVKSVLGLDPTVNVNPHNNIADVSFVNKFSPAEMKAYLNRLYVRPDRMGVNNTVTAGGVLSYLRPIHEKLSSAKIEAEKLNKLAPEIEQSKILVSSSIMSPNDLQDGEFIFSFNDIPALEDDPDLLKEVTELYNQYFNNVLNLGIKSYDWIGDAMYVSGAKCLLILPIATQIELRHRSQKEANANGYNAEFGFESFKEFSKGNDDYLFSGKRLSLADYLKGYNPSISNLVPSMESFGVKTPTEYCSTDKLEQCAKVDPSYRNRYGSSYVTGIENMVINLKAKMSEGDIIRITENTDSFRYINTSKETVEEDIWSKLAAKYGFNNRPVREEMVVLKANPSNYKHRGHPTLIELPTEAVIPIFIPGAPNEHLGYFVMLDEHGQPLTADDNRAATDTTGCAGGSSAATFEAIFGTSCCNASYFNQNNDYTQMGNLIFNNLLDSYIRTRMKGILHRDDLQLSRFNALSTILFQRTLESKETTIVFVPPMLMHYFAFDYDRRTGCGKSKTSDIQFILSLRTTLMMANVVSAVNDAIEHKKIEFGVDDKHANIEAIMELIANIFIEKNKFDGCIDPSEIMLDIYSNQLTIIPKNIPGLSDMSVDVQSASGSSSRVDDQTLEQLNNLIVTQLDVPAAALNQLSEPEYARSLVVGNLFFAKKITRYQHIVCKMIRDFIQTYTLVDPIFQKALHKKLASSFKGPVVEKLSKKTNELKRDNPNQYDDPDSLHMLIMTRVKVELPKPNIVVDKTQFEEINNYVNNIQTIADKFFNQEMIPSEDNLAQMALPLAKSKWMKDQIAKFITEVGSFQMCDIPDLDDLDVCELTDYIQVFENMGAGIIKHRTSISQPSEDGGGGFGGDSGFGDSSSSGASDGFDMGGGDSGGGFDMGGSDTGGSDTGSSDFDKLGGDTGDTGSAPAENNESNTSEGDNPTMLARHFLPKKKR